LPDKDWFSKQSHANHSSSCTIFDGTGDCGTQSAAPARFVKGSAAQKADASLTKQICLNRSFQSHILIGSQQFITMQQLLRSRKRLIAKASSRIVTAKTRRPYPVQS
jgi:aconitase B